MKAYIDAVESTNLQRQLYQLSYTDPIIKNLLAIVECVPRLHHFRYEVNRENVPLEDHRNKNHR